ncbi:unnamed protein product [Soboliphyme baturini]|uniref:Uncharacterized protein n=1 Tax=Soboliphyme baturini TaxID=241478 RepID=A0A183J912_9BILA|nr:unnamed protein product [Soboliphyme baturini]
MGPTKRQCAPAPSSQAAVRRSPAKNCHRGHPPGLGRNLLFPYRP